ncbi:MAG: DUF3135 domain-containing protein [Zetaproteobacteria bacterium]|nr:DUF3135 domain-containing protein [Zetaproteobacteria bacterium]
MDVPSHDDLMTLLAASPEEFEELVAELKTQCIAEASSEDSAQSMRQLQWRIDSELRGIVDPVERMNRFVAIFWRGVHQFHDGLQNPSTAKKVFDVK